MSDAFHQSDTPGVMSSYLTGSKYVNDWLEKRGYVDKERRRLNQAGLDLGQALQTGKPTAETAAKASAQRERIEGLIAEVDARGGFSPARNRLRKLLDQLGHDDTDEKIDRIQAKGKLTGKPALPNTCLLYTSPSPRDRQKSRMPSSA